MKHKQTYKQSSLLLVSIVLGMGLASCSIPNARNQQGIVDNSNGTRGGTNGVRVGGDALSLGGGGAGPGAGNGLDDPNRDKTVKDDDTTTPQGNGLFFTKRTDPIWKIVGKLANKSHLRLLDADRNLITDNKEPLDGFTDGDKDNFPDDYERLTAAMGFAAPNPQQATGFLNGNVHIRLDIVKALALAASKYNADADNQISNQEAWEFLHDEWDRKKTSLWGKTQDDNLLYWFSNAVCALDASRGMLDSTYTPPNNIELVGLKRGMDADSGAIIRVIFQNHLHAKDGDANNHHLQVEPSRTLSKRVFDISGDPSKELFAFVEGGMKNALFHNPFYEGSARFINGPSNSAIKDNKAAMVVYEGDIAFDGDMKAVIASVDEVGKISPGDESVFFLMSHNGDTKLSKMYTKGFGNLVTMLRTIKGNKIRDAVTIATQIEKIKKGCVRSDQDLQNMTTLTGSTTPTHFMVAAVYLGKHSKDNFFKENILVQYTKPEFYNLSLDKTDPEGIKAAEALFEKHEGYPASQSDKVFQLIPQEIASFIVKDKKHPYRVLTPFLPDNADLAHFGQSDLSGAEYWSQYANSGKDWLARPKELLLNTLPFPASGGPLVYPPVQDALDAMLTSNESVSDDGSRLASQTPADNSNQDAQAVLNQRIDGALNTSLTLDDTYDPNGYAGDPEEQEDEDTWQDPELSDQEEQGGWG